jgi:hypothetical protein
MNKIERQRVVELIQKAIVRRKKACFRLGKGFKQGSQSCESAILPWKVELHALYRAKKVGLGQGEKLSREANRLFEEWDKENDPDSKKRLYHETTVITSVGLACTGNYSLLRKLADEPKIR